MKILFVCLGNICRSPMAEFVMKDMVRKAELAGNFEIASGGYQPGGDREPGLSSAREKLREHGISCEGKCARQMNPEDYGKYDLLIGMEQRNLRDMQRICGGNPEKKMHLLMEFAGQKKDIADPWYTGDFETTWQQVERGCRGLLGYCTGQTQE